jgi:rubredoxin
MSCSNCGFVKTKNIKMEIDENPKLKKCRLCNIEYDDKKEHNKTDRHIKIKTLVKNLKLIKDDNLDNFEGLINNYLINN